MCNMKCIFTHNEIKSVGKYIRQESKTRNLSSQDLRFLLYKENYGEDLCNNFKKYYEELLYSIPDFKKKFGIHSYIVYFLAKYHGVKLRTIKESAQLIGKQKAQKTFKVKYGIENPSQLDWVNEKKKVTFIKHYGVDNIWKTKNYIANLENIFIEKYKMTRRDYCSIKSKEVWNSKTDEEKKQWLLNSIHSDKSQITQLRGYNKSKLETRVEYVLNKLSISYIHTYMIKLTNKKRYFYDFYIKDLNQIIEINGDYWHANPIIYNENDLLHYKFKTISAKEIWDKDKLKCDTARERGYKIETIWESDMKSDREITNRIEKIIYENS